MAPIRVVASSMSAPSTAVWDPSELLDVNVDQLARRIALIPPHRLAIRGTVARSRRPAPARFRMFCTRRRRQPDLEADVVGTPPASQPQPNHPTLQPTWCQRFGDRCGRDDAIHKTSHTFGARTGHAATCCTVLASTWNRSAVAVTDQPPSTTQRTIRRRPLNRERRIRVQRSSVGHEPSLRVVSLSTHSLARRAHPITPTRQGQRPRLSHLAPLFRQALDLQQHLAAHHECDGFDGEAPEGEPGCEPWGVVAAAASEEPAPSG